MITIVRIQGILTSLRLSPPVTQEEAFGGLHYLNKGALLSAGRLVHQCAFYTSYV